MSVPYIGCSIFLKGLNDCQSLQHLPVRTAGQEENINYFSNISYFYSNNSQYLTFMKMEQDFVVKFLISSHF